MRRKVCCTPRHGKAWLGGGLVPPAKKRHTRLIVLDTTAPPIDDGSMQHVFVCAAAIGCFQPHFLPFALSCTYMFFASMIFLERTIQNELPDRANPRLVCVTFPSPIERPMSRMSLLPFLVSGIPLYPDWVACSNSHARTCRTVGC